MDKEVYYAEVKQDYEYGMAIVIVVAESKEEAITLINKETEGSRAYFRLINGEDICKINRSCSGVVTIESYIE